MSYLIKQPTVTPAERTGFGEVSVAEMTPVIQLDGIYDLNDVSLDEVERFTALGGIGTIRDGLFTAECDGDAFSYGVIRSRRFLRYRPGQGAIGRFTARYEVGAGCELRAGLFNQEGGIYVGIETTGDFGVMRESGGRAEIRQLEITTASSSAGIATVTLNGTDIDVSLINNSGITTATAAGIATNTFAGWNVEQKDGILTFLSTSTFPKPNTFAFAPGTTGAVGTFTTLRTAATPTETWTYQSNFNVDKLDGTGPSGMTIDPTKINVFQIQFRWLGAGQIAYSIEDETTGDFISFHREHYVNQNVNSWVANPSFKIGYVAYNANGDGPDGVGVGTVQGASMLAAIEGQTKDTKKTYSYSILKSGLTANTDQHIFTIRNPIVFDGKINTREIKLLSISYAVEVGANQFESTQIKMTRYSTLDSNVNHQFKTVSNTDIASVSNVTGTITYDTNKAISYSVVAPPDSGATVNLLPYIIEIDPGQSISITTRCAASHTPHIAINWILI